MTRHRGFRDAPAGEAPGMQRNPSTKIRGGGRVWKIASSEGVVAAEVAGKVRFGDLWATFSWSFMEPENTVENRKRKWVYWVYWGVRTAKKEIPLLLLKILPKCFSGYGPYHIYIHREIHNLDQLQIQYLSIIQRAEDASRKIALYEKQIRLSNTTLHLLLREYATSRASLTDILQFERELIDYEFKKFEMLSTYNIVSAEYDKLMSKNDFMNIK